MTNKKLASGVILLLIITAIYGYRYVYHPAGNAVQAGAAMPVGVSTVIERTITRWDEFSGVLSAVERVDIRPRVGGTVEAIDFEDGERVHKGQLLFTIDPKPYEVELARVKAALTAAKAQESYAKTEFERLEKLVAERVVSRQAYDAAQEQYRSASAGVAIAEAAVKQAQLNLDYTTITAPIAGRISRAEITVGNLVNGGGDAPVLTSIVSLDPIYADFDADEHTFLKYLHGNNNSPEKLKAITVKLGLADGHEFPYIGTVKSFDNSLNAQAGTIRVRAVFSNPEAALVPGLFARVRMSGAGQEKALLITEQAIGTDQDRKFVLVVGDDNKVSYREVVPGPVVEGLRVIEKGLNPADKIVVNGLQRTRPGMVVIPEIVPMDNPSASTPSPQPEKK